MWFRNFKRNLVAYGYEGDICPVNPTADVVEGYRCYPSLDEIEGTIDAVAVVLGAERCPAAVQAAVARGVDDIVVVATGFAEVGSALGGDRLQAALVEACGPETRLYGPNGVGFADFGRRLCLIGEPIPYNNAAGAVSLLSQSGALLATMMAAIIEDGGGIDWCVSFGNAAHFDLARAIDYVVRRATSKVIAVYAESLQGRPDLLSDALRRAAASDMTVVMLKAGRSALGRRIALSHTASVAGDDAQVDAFLRAHGAIRVESLEELARVSVLAPLRRAGRGRGVAIIGSSGGQAAVASELSTRDGLRLAKLGPETMNVVRSKTRPGSFFENPFDLTGGAGMDAELFRAVFSDDDVGFVLSPWMITFPDDSAEQRHNRPLIELAVNTARETASPTVISSLVCVPWTDWILGIRAANPEMAVVRGIETTIRALSRLFPGGGPSEDDAGGEGDSDERPVGLVGEAEGREVLTALGIPVVAGERCDDVDAAVRAAEGIGWPVVVKLDVRGVAHKAKLGLVTVGCRDREDLEDAVSRSLESLLDHGLKQDDVTGILVQRQASGAEVLLGLQRSELGAFLTVARGGVTAGKGTQSATYLLPVDESLLGAAVASASGLDPQASGCARAVAAAMTLCEQFGGGTLRGYATVEVNPAMVSAESCEFVDVLMISS